MRNTFANIEESDHVSLNIRKEPLHVERTEGQGEDKKIYLTGINTGEYQLTYDEDEKMCRFYRKKSEKSQEWTSPRFVENVEVIEKSASKASLYV